MTRDAHPRIKHNQNLQSERTREEYRGDAQHDAHAQRRQHHAVVVVADGQYPHDVREPSPLWFRHAVQESADKHDN